MGPAGDLGNDAAEAGMAVPTEPIIFMKATSSIIGPNDAVELCPRLLFPADGRPLLTKCCLLEDSIADQGVTVAVPWGASLEQVKQALAAIAKAAEPAWAPA